MTGPLPPELEARVAALAGDRRRGALELAREAVDLLVEVGEASPWFHPLAAALRRVRPPLAPVARAVEFCLAGPLAERAAAARRLLEEGPREAARRLGARLGPGRRLVVLSRSSAVAAAIEHLRPARLYVLESRPGGEGVAEAARWAARGYAVELLADLEMARAVGEADAVLLGVDAELPDGSIVNKVGSFPLALVARELGRPVFALTHPFKRVAAPQLEEDDPALVLTPPPQGVTVRCFLFEVVPGGLVERVGG